MLHRLERMPSSVTHYQHSPAGPAQPDHHHAVVQAIRLLPEKHEDEAVSPRTMRELLTPRVRSILVFCAFSTFTCESLVRQPLRLD